MFNYNIIAFYNFFIHISNFLKEENIIPSYSKIERKIRTTLKFTNKNDLQKLHESQQHLLTKVYIDLYISNKFIFNIINLIPNELIFNDYITFFLQKYKSKEAIYKYHHIYI